MNAIVDGARNLDSLRAHQLELIAVGRWRELGRPVPAEIAALQRYVELVALSAQAVLRHIQDAYAGRVVLMKGLEVAQLYPTVAMRPFGDIDLLVEDAEAAQAALLANGFEEMGEPEIFRDIHHLRPLRHEITPLVIELHRAPKWPGRLGPAPTASQLLNRAVPSTTGVPGLLTLAPADHAICLAAHAWAHEPLLRIGDLLDVRLMAAQATPEELLAAARDLGMARIWATTTRTADAILGTGRGTLPLHTWARNVAHVRDRSVLEWHLQKWMSPFCELPFPANLLAALHASVSDLAPARGESWSSKLRRLRRSARRAHVSRAEHDRLIGADAEIGNTVLERIRTRTRMEDP